MFLESGVINSHVECRMSHCFYLSVLAIQQLAANSRTQALRHEDRRISDLSVSVAIIVSISAILQLSRLLVAPTSGCIVNAVFVSWRTDGYNI